MFEPFPGERDLEKGRRLSASAKFRRAAVYYQVAERMQGRDNPRRMDAYSNALHYADRWITLGRLPIEHVDLPYEGKSFPALFWQVRSQDGRPAPAVVICNGLDSTKEIILWTGIGRALTERGISALFVDQPGSGAAVRLNGITGVHDSERWAAPAVDWLEARKAVDPKRIGRRRIQARADHRMAQHLDYLTCSIPATAALILMITHYSVIRFAVSSIVILSRTWTDGSVPI